MRGVLGGGRRFELLGEGPGGVPLWMVNMFLGGVMKQMILPNSSSRSYAIGRRDRKSVYQSHVLCDW